MTVETQKKAPLDEVMMAMDVVDTLRHRQNLVERELSSDDRDEKLIERLRDIYRNQGIEVPDHILAEGVAALKEDRFVYDPPSPGMSVTLARMYVERGKWFKRLAATVAAIVALIFGNWFVFERPEQKQIAAVVASTNDAIRSEESRINGLQRRIVSARDVLTRSVEEVPDAVRSAVLARKTIVEQSLSNAETRISSIKTFGEDAEFDAKITVGDYDEQFVSELNEKLKTQSSRLDEADRMLRTSEAGVAEISEFRAIGEKAEVALKALSESSAKTQTAGKGVLRKIQASLSRGDYSTASEELELLNSLGHLEQEINDEFAAIENLATDNNASVQARQLGEHGIRAMQGGDVRAASASLEQLKQMKEQLEQAYTLRVVSRPGEMSAVWREGKTGGGIKNYYLVVEAIAPDGTTLSFPVTSEEDQSTKNTKIWGVRVDEQTFNKIYRDKKRDGIVDQNIIAEKRRGELRTDYSFPVGNTGVPGRITKW